jgi:lipopolysaccharide export system protein LptA
MRGTRWLILVVILAIVGGVAVTFRLQQEALRRQAPTRPKALPPELNSAAEDWQWTQSEGGRTVVRITAKNVKQSKETAHIDLERVELHIFHKDGAAYDRVRSARADFSPEDRKLYSEGDVEITLGVPIEGPPKRTLVSIRSSGVTFDSTTGKAATERPATFLFENGDGKSMGASYDPGTKELRLASQVELYWKSPGAGSKAMKLEAGELLYREAESTIWLTPWARLTRENTLIEGANTTVILEEGLIRRVETRAARGTDRYPARRLDYAADEMTVYFTPDTEVEKISGHKNARLVSTTATSETTTTADRVDLEFAAGTGESVLSRVLAAGNSMAVSKPLPAEGRPLPETRVLRSEMVQVTMRAGGQELEQIETHSPGRLELQPNRAGQRQRTLDGERLWITYGPRNEMESFRAVDVRTRTEPTAEERARKRPPALTRSKHLLARFEPGTSRMTRMEQWDDFSYEAGGRHARAARAVLESAEDRILLENAARVWDASGSTAADRIRLDQRTGDFTAEGKVNSSRRPDEKKPATGMLSGGEPLQATASTMRSANGNRLIHYEGGVVLWQGANRLTADQVDIDREKRVLLAAGSVVSQFLDSPPADGAAGGRRDGQKKKTAAAPLFTVVKSAKLVYTDEDRLAHYTGGVLLNRPGLQVKSAELRAHLAEAGADSRLEKAFARGTVEIVQKAAGRTRTGTGEQADYFAGEEKIVLRGEDAQLIDSARGQTRGAQLTYFANDDRLLVNGAPERPAVSRIRRK